MSDIERDFERLFVKIESLEDDNKVLEDALRMLWNDVGGGTKKCGHDFCCSCAGDNAKKVLNRG